jgi:adenine-specific DNA-methyltransferase
MVHVGAVDAPVSVGDVTQIAVEFKRAIGSGKDAPKTNGVDVLGWDFAFEMNEVAKQQAAAANIQIRFFKIPRDVMDKRAVAQGDIHFFELAALSVEVKAQNREVALMLTDFVIPPDDVPEDARKAVKHWSQCSTTNGRPITRAKSRRWRWKRSTPTLSRENTRL